MEFERRKLLQEMSGKMSPDRKQLNMMAAVAATEEPKYFKTTNLTKKITSTVHITNWIAHFVLTLVAIPIVIRSKYITSSRALLTGCLNLTIDKAPIIPRDKAMFPEIVLVITYVMIGRTINVTV